MAVGQPVQEVSRQFDLYWNSQSAYPAGSLVGEPGADGVATMEAMFRTLRADSESVAYLETVLSTPVVRELLQGQLPLEWTRRHWSWVLRPRESARYDRPHRRAAVSGAGANNRQAGQDAGPCFPVLRAGGRRDHRLERARDQRRASKFGSSQTRWRRRMSRPFMPAMSNDASICFGRVFGCWSLKL